VLLREFLHFKREPTQSRGLLGEVADSRPATQGCQALLKS
jgi:hypothetical protein